MHPLEQKLATIRYYVNRIDTYDIDYENRQKEIDTMKQIIHNNEYDTSILNRIHRNRKENRNKSREKRNRPCLRIWEEKQGISQNSSRTPM
jgi:uncharacterized protein (UPF0335 family)